MRALDKLVRRRRRDPVDPEGTRGRRRPRVPFRQADQAGATADTDPIRRRPL